MEKASVFIDGGYLNRILNNFGDSGQLDYLIFSDLISDIVKVKRLRTYYYHCLPLIKSNNKEDEKRYSKMQLFITSLKRLPRFEVKLGKLQFIGGKFRQKMIDVLLSLDLVNISFDKQIEQAIIIAGDADFIPAIKKAKDCGVIVHLFYHPSSVHNELLDEVDELHIISEDLIKSCIKN